MHACANATVFNESLGGCTDPYVSGSAVAAAGTAVAESQSLLDGICVGKEDGLYARKNTSGEYMVSGMEENARVSLLCWTFGNA